MFFLALSCLQGRPMADAAAELWALGPDGLQLTPGNQPTPGFSPPGPTRTHHGFAVTHWRQDVWGEEGGCLVASDSVHPPLVTESAAGRFLEVDGPLPILETMYPRYALGTGAELEHAMNRGLRLAVDVSHLFLQLEAGVLTKQTWARLQDYAHIAEVHVSRNNGRTDAHQPLTADTFGLEWAREQLRAGTPVVVESYFHRLGADARRAQCALFDRDRP